MYAGEHAAGTEFMIGPLFLAAGASLQDLIVGLLLGNFLAVLIWRFLVTPIAMSKRLTLLDEEGGSRCWEPSSGSLPHHCGWDVP